MNNGRQMFKGFGAFRVWPNLMWSWMLNKHHVKTGVFFAYEKEVSPNRWSDRAGARANSKANTRRKDGWAASTWATTQAVPFGSDSGLLRRVTMRDGAAPTRCPRGRQCWRRCSLHWCGTAWKPAVHAERYELQSIESESSKLVITMPVTVENTHDPWSHFRMRELALERLLYELKI